MQATICSGKEQGRIFKKFIASRVLHRPERFKFYLKANGSKSFLFISLAVLRRALEIWLQ